MLKSLKKLKFKENSTSLKEMRMLRSQIAKTTINSNQQIIQMMMIVKKQKTTGALLKSLKTENIVKFSIQMMKSLKAESSLKSQKKMIVGFSNQMIRKNHETEVSPQADDVTTALNVAGTGMNTMA